MASEDCGPTCRNHHECTHFYWSKEWSSGTCILKRGSVSVRDFTHKSTIEEYINVCGFIEPLFDWQDNVAKGCDFPGNDLSHKRTENVDECRYLCERTPKCTHFTFYSKTVKCWLKEGSVSKSRALGAEGAECGLVANNFENKHIGCYGDSHSRDLESVHYREHPSNTLEDCFQFCRGHNYRYAGLQFGSECWCSDTYGKYGTSNRCNTPCTGNAEQICGGPRANSVYDVSPKIRSDRRKRSVTKPNQKPLKFLLSSIEYSALNDKILENELSSAICLQLQSSSNLISVLERMVQKSNSAGWSNGWSIVVLDRILSSESSVSVNTIENLFLYGVCTSSDQAEEKKSFQAKSFFLYHLPENNCFNDVDERRFESSSTASNKAFKEILDFLQDERFTEEFFPYREFKIHRSTSIKSPELLEYLVNEVSEAVETNKLFLSERIRESLGTFWNVFVNPVGLGMQIVTPFRANSFLRMHFRGYDIIIFHTPYSRCL